MFDQIPWACFEQAFVVDGDSTDGTREYVEERGLQVISQKQRGLGAAMIEARQHCTTDAIIFFHPDGNEDPSDLLVIRARGRQAPPFWNSVVRLREDYDRRIPADPI